MISIPSFELIPNKKAVVGLLSGLALTGLALTGIAAQAATINGVNNPAALGTTSFLSWGGLGWNPVNPVLGNNVFPGVGFEVTATQGGGASLWQSVEAAFQADETPGVWGGNFSAGESVLYNGATSYNQTPGAIILHFTNPVLGAGVHVQQNWNDATANDPFNVYVSAYGVHNNLLLQYSFLGTPGQGADGSAAFGGFLSSASDISTITIWTDSGDFAIGALAVNTPDSSSTAALLGSAVAGLWLLRKRK